MTPELLLKRAPRDRDRPSRPPTDQEIEDYLRRYRNFVDGLNRPRRPEPKPEPKVEPPPAKAPSDVFDDVLDSDLLD